MKVALTIFLFIFISLNLQAIELNEKSSKIELLPLSKVYLDKTNALSKDEVIKKNFSYNTKATLNLGIVPNTALWIKFTLQNTTDTTLTKILEYTNPETEDLYFFDGNKTVLDGMFHHQKNRETLNPIFEIKLEPYEARTYYLKAHCKISTLIAKLRLYNKDDFLHTDYRHLTILFVFFSVIATLFIYNFMLFVFTKDITYFYYIVYLLSVMFFESIYLGVAQLYFFSNEVSIFITKATIGYITLLVIPMTLFTISFLNTSRFPKLHFILKFYLYLLPIVSLLSFNNFLFDLNIMILYFPLAFTLIFTALYALRQGTQEALYYLLGWSILIISLSASVYQSLGQGLNVPYMNELAFALEALLFSVALAHRIKVISKEKATADKKLIEFHQKEQKLLEKLVNEKTKDLQSALNEKEVLYKELNHRVKNNLQMILSLIKLQINKTQSEETKKELNITKNRVNSIAELYSALGINNSQTFQTLTYFESITKNIKENFDKDVTFHYDIKQNINMHDSIYSGLILNELVTNSFKYAFEKSGIINISTYLKDRKIYMLISDNGIGYEEPIEYSLGLNIVQTLATKQLQGELLLESNNGVKATISWSST